ncbi:MAG: hypothetical protein WEB67_14255, partial [Acidimicrobiia bacterium]
RRRALALLAAFGLLASLITVFSPPALGDGNPPSVECSSTNPAWNGDFWKVEKDDGTLSEVETNVTGAITLAANGSWTNNNEDPVFRVVLKIDGDDDDDDDENQVLSGMWKTGEGGTIDLTLNGLDHVTFRSTSEVSEEPEPTTTTTISTTTTSAGATTTTSAGPTTTTSPDASTATTLGESPPTTPSDETTTNAAANPTEVSDSGLAGDASQADESVEEADGSETDGGDWLGPEGSLPDADRDTTVAGLMNGGSGEPPALGQASISSDADPDVIRNSHQWPTQVDLAILGALIAAIAVLIDRRRLRRLVGHLGKRRR